MKSLKKGCSLVTCAMNRTDNLLLAIQSWGGLDEVSEIIVLDWSSDIPIQHSDLLRNCASKDIKLLRVNNQPKWILSHAFNLAISFAKYDHLLKLDSDVILDPTFLSFHSLPEASFFRGNWKIARNENELHLNGQLYCKTEDFWRVNGYHEGITTYGWDDSDLYNRLSVLDLEGLDFNYDLFNHIESTQEARYINQSLLNLDDLLNPDLSSLSGKDKFDAMKIVEHLNKMRPPENCPDIRLFYEIQRNRIWSELNPWQPDSKRKSWDIVLDSANTYTIHELN